MSNKEIENKKENDVRKLTIKAPAIIKKDDVLKTTIKAPAIIKKDDIQKVTIKAPTIIKNPNNYIHNDIPYRMPIKEEDSLTNEDKQELYPYILKYLDDLAKKCYNSNDMDNIIKNVQHEIPKNDKKKEKAYNILRIMFLALYKTKDKQDLIDRLRAEYINMDRKEIDKLIEDIRAELKQYTEEDLYKIWIQNAKDKEIEELINILTKENQKESSISLKEKEPEEFIEAGEKKSEQFKNNSIEKTV